MDDIAARIAAEYKVWSAKASAQSKVATDPDAKRDLAATANCLDSLAGLRRHAVLSYLPLASYVLIGTSCRMKVIAGTNFKKRDEAAAKGAELANFLACNLPKWKRAFTIASTHLVRCGVGWRCCACLHDCGGAKAADSNITRPMLHMVPPLLTCLVLTRPAALPSSSFLPAQEANLELGDLLVEGCFRRFDRMARWLRAEGVAVPSHLSGRCRVAAVMVGVLSGDCGT